jgi:ubiquinone/menaquinone biosynthesis C-methylase UbiE
LDRRPAHRSRSAITDAYDLSAEAWITGPEPLYRKFAGELVHALASVVPGPLAGLKVLDLGAGAGAVSGALQATCARAVALDTSPAMLSGARRCLTGLPAVAADAIRLPFGYRCFDAVLAGFVLNHVPEPWRLLAEAARVTRPQGILMAMTFAAGDEHPAKAAVEGVARRWGWAPPAWYDEQRRWAALTDTSAGLKEQAEKAGLKAATVDIVEVAAGPRTAMELTYWRLGMAHMAELVTSLSPVQRQDLAAEAAQAIGAQVLPLNRELLILSSHLPA